MNIETEDELATLAASLLSPHIARKWVPAIECLILERKLGPQPADVWASLIELMARPQSDLLVAHSVMLSEAAEAGRPAACKRWEEFDGLSIDDLYKRAGKALRALHPRPRGKKPNDDEAGIRRLFAEHDRDPSISITARLRRAIKDGWFGKPNPSNPASIERRVRSKALFKEEMRRRKKRKQAAGQSASEENRSDFLK